MIKNLPCLSARLLLLAAVCFPTIFSSTAAASGIGECSHGQSSSRRFAKPAAAKPPAAKLPEIDERRPYDVLSYDLFLDWRTAIFEQAPRYSGVQEMKIRITEATKVVVVDASFIRIDSAWINGSRFSISPTAVNDRFEFTFLNDRTAGEELTIRMAFTRFSGENKGVYFFPKDLYVGPGQIGDSVFVEEDILYTQSEPFDAQFWMPCMNLPYDKSESKISILLPGGFQGISNGLLESVQQHVDGSKTFHWKSDRPIASYLMVANASKFVEWDEYYVRLSDPTDSVRAIFYAWKEDYDNTATDGSQYNARHAYRNTVRILREFSARFGEYPFEQYGQVPVQPYGFGGMEHQGMSTVNRRWLRGFDESGIAHEIGHQWFGDKVTCETWDDLWLNEGFASYTEAIWAEVNGGNEAYFNVVNGYTNYYFERGLITASIFGPPALQAFQLPYAPLVYGKASAVIHLLRRLVNNDTLFFNAISDYTDAFAYSHVTTAKFEQYMTSRLGIDLTQFFKQWIYGPAHPQYYVGWNQVEQTLKLKVDQRQTEQDVFEAPLRFFIEYADSGIDTVIVENDQRTQYFSLTVDREISNVAIDPDWSVISYREIDRDLSLSVSGSTKPEVAFNITSNTLHLTSAEPLTGTIRIVDVLGRMYNSSDIVSQQSVIIDVNALPTGSYFVTMETGSKRETYRFLR